MTNYLSNAIHYAGGKKEISIRCREQEKNVRISVFNTGDPIPEEDIDKIWSKSTKSIRRVRESTAAAESVFPLLKKILEDHGGKVWATSRLGIRHDHVFCT